MNVCSATSMTVFNYIVGLISFRMARHGEMACPTFVVGKLARF